MARAVPAGPPPMMRMEGGDMFVCVEFFWVDGGLGFCVFGWVDGLILMRMGNDRGKGKAIAWDTYPSVCC